MQELVLKNKKKLGTSRCHPWVYSGAVAAIPEKAEYGDTLEVRSAEGALVGYGHYSKGKSIICRIFEFTSTEIKIDEAFWLKKFRKALEYRKALGFSIPSSTESYRLFYSEGDELPGLICDVYGSSASAHLMTEGMQKLQTLIVQFLKSEVGVKSLYIKTPQESYWVDKKDKEFHFEENGLKLVSLIEEGQKTGYFLDQRDNRKLVSQFSKGKTVLDAFCYLGGFGLNALKGGAKEVCFLDASQVALEQVQGHVMMNFPDAKYNLEASDCFEYLRKMPADYFDLIILDPPAFVKHADYIKQAARAYKDINMIALKKIKAGSFLFTYSCSQHMSRELFRTVVYQAALDAGRKVRVMKELCQSPDHPVNIYHPEGDYLKGLMLYVS